MLHIEGSSQGCTGPICFSMLHTTSMMWCEWHLRSITFVSLFIKSDPFFSNSGLWCPRSKDYRFIDGSYPSQGGQCGCSRSHSQTGNCLMCHPSFMDWRTNQRSSRAVQTKPEFRAGHSCYTPAVCRRDPNSRAPELKCSIKVEPLKILEDSSVQIFSG